MRNRRRLGAHSPAKPYTPQGKINTTGLDSRNVKTPRGWVQGYNAQAATNERQIVIAAELTNASADFGQLGVMVEAVGRELRAAGVAELPEVVLADAGYRHQSQMQALAGDGLAALIPPDANKRKGARPGWNGGLYAFIRRALATPAGAALYRKRTVMTEPVFGGIRFNRKIERFQRRGRAACRSECGLIIATHNLRSYGAQPQRPTRPDRRPRGPAGRFRGSVHNHNRSPHNQGRPDLYATTSMRSAFQAPRKQPQRLDAVGQGSARTRRVAADSGPERPLREELADPTWSPSLPKDRRTGRGTPALKLACFAADKSCWGVPAPDRLVLGVAGAGGRPRRRGAARIAPRSAVWKRELPEAPTLQPMDLGSLRVRGWRSDYWPAGRSGAMGPPAYPGIWPLMA
jgi:hypothetical protein